MYMYKESIFRSFSFLFTRSSVTCKAKVRTPTRARIHACTCAYEWTSTLAHMHLHVRVHIGNNTHILIWLCCMLFCISFHSFRWHRDRTSKLSGRMRGKCSSALYGVGMQLRSRSGNKILKHICFYVFRDIVYKKSCLAFLTQGMWFARLLGRMLVYFMFVNYCPSRIRLANVV